MITNIINIMNMNNIIDMVDTTDSISVIYINKSINILTRDYFKLKPY